MSWDNLIGRLIIGPNLLKEVEPIEQKKKQNVKIAQDKQNSFVDLKRIHAEFNMGDHVSFQVRPKMFQVGTKISRTISSACQIRVSGLLAYTSSHHKGSHCI